MIQNRSIMGLALIGSLALGLQAEHIMDDNKKIVLDSTNGLMWQDDAVGSTMNWATALTTCESLTLGGYSDWRLPNQNELQSIARGYTLMSSIFANFGYGYYWSSTSTGNTESAFGISTNGGDGESISKTYDVYVRCVRGGQ